MLVITEVMFMKKLITLFIHSVGEHRYGLKEHRIVQPCYTKKISKGITIPEFFCYANQHDTMLLEPVQLKIQGWGA